VAFEERRDGLAASCVEVQGEGIEGVALGWRERDGECAAADGASLELPCARLPLAEKLVAVMLVGHHHQVGWRVALLGECADLFGELDRQGEPDFVAGFAARGCGWNRPERAGDVGPVGMKRERGLVGTRLLSPGFSRWAFRVALWPRGVVGGRFAGDAEAGELGFGEPGHAHATGLGAAGGVV